MKFIFISAYMESGGNQIQRHLCDNPQLISYPFESQMGTKYSSNVLNYFYHFRYAWPVFPTEITAEESYQLMYDEELKTYLRTPERSKFKHCGMAINEEDRLALYLELMTDKFINRRNCIESFFMATYRAWQNYNDSHQETHFVGYYPLLGIEADTIFSDFPDCHIIHLVRNPISSYGDTVKRPFPLSLEKYCQGWNILHQAALLYKQKYNGNFHILKYEDFIKDKRLNLEPILNKIGVAWSDNCLYPSFNGKELKNTKPWGTIEFATPEYNIESFRNVPLEQRLAIVKETLIIGDKLGYYPENVLTRNDGCLCYL